MSRQNSNSTEVPINSSESTFSPSKSNFINSQQGLNIMSHRTIGTEGNTMPILSPLKMSPPSLILTTDQGTEGHHNDETETNFFKDFTQGSKFSTISPLPHSQFPTPYSSNQDNRNNIRKKGIHNGNQNNNINNTSMLSSGSQPHQSVDSSMLENSINAGLYTGKNLHQQMQQPLLQLQDHPLGENKVSKSSNSSMNSTEPTVDLMNNNDGDTLEDMNMQPSTVLQFNNNFPNEFLLASPEQLKEYLFESPGAFNLFHKTPAKTPLRFVTDSKDMNINLTSNTKSNTSSNLIHLFTSGNGKNDEQDKRSTASNDFGMMNNFQDAFLSRTPLEKIDINLMFNQSNILSNSVSPSKKVSMSLTPYGRRILNEMGTPFSKTFNSTNSALVDFQRARMDINTNEQPVQSSPDDKENLNARTLKNKLSLTPNNKKKGRQPRAKLTRKNLKKNNKKNEKSNRTTNSKTIINHIPSMDSNKNGRLKKTSNTNLPYEKNGNHFENDNDNDNDFEADNNIYGSSPTTIQLNSSVTKSISKLDNNRIPNLKNMNLIDERLGDKLFDLNARNIPLSPTPKSSFSSNKLDIDTLKIPELPKMGSFRSDANNSVSLPASLAEPTNNNNAQMNNINNNSNPSHNNNNINNNNSHININNKISLSVATSTLALSIERDNNNIKMKKVKKSKPKKPKFQVFVSSINKFNEPSSFVPVSPKAHKKINNKPSNLKRTQSLMIKNKKKLDLSQDLNSNSRDDGGKLMKVRRSNSMASNENFHEMY